MARKPRIDYPGAWHHVTAHAHGDDPLFRNAVDARYFLTLVEQAIHRFGLEVHSYCLMTNHYHLLVRSTRGNLSRSMAYLNSRFSQHMIEVHDLRGSVFSGRFHSTLIDNDCYLLTASRYIARNPVDAQMVDDPKDHRWSSFPIYLSSQPHPWLTRSLLPKVSGDLDRYLRFVYQPVPSDKRYHSPTLTQARQWGQTPSVRKGSDPI